MAPGLLGALPSPRRRLRGCAQPCLALAFWVWGRVLACWPWGWDGWLHSSLRSGPDSSLVGLALATGPLDGTHGLWLFFLIPLGCVCDCDSGLCCGAPAEGSWLVLREVACQAQGSNGWRSTSSSHSDTSPVHRGWPTGA